MDYDSMGDCSRFPRVKKKSLITLKQRLINLLKKDGRRRV